MAGKQVSRLDKWEISGLQAGWLVAGGVSLTGHALAVSHFIQQGGRDAWMAGILGLPVAALAVAAQVSLSRRYPGKTLAQYLPKVLGYLGYPLGVLYSIYFLSVVVFTMRMTTDWLIDTILPETPAWALAILYMTAVTYAALGGLDSLARINQFTLPLLTFLGIVVSVSTTQAKDYSLLLPILENGWAPVLSVTLLGMGYFGETSILSMFSGYVAKKDGKRLVRNYLIALCFVVTTFTGPMAGSVATLGYRVAQNMAYPTFQHWLMVSFARFFERTDLLAVHQWLAGAYVRCALFLLLGVQALWQSTKVKLPLKWGVIGGAVAVTVISELAWNTKPDFDQFVHFMYLPAGAVIGTLTPMVIWSIDSVRRLFARGSGAQHGA